MLQKLNNTVMEQTFLLHNTWKSAYNEYQLITGTVPDEDP
jgi:hypothetical protein